MRILLVSHRFPPDGIAGVERVTQSLAVELTKAGHNVQVVTRRPDPGRPVLRTMRERLPDGTVVHRIEGGSVKLDQFLLDDEMLERRLAVVMAEFQPEIVHVMHLLGLSARCLDTARLFGAAIVISLHDYYFACPTIFLRKPGGTECAGPRGGVECAETCFAGEGAPARLRWGLRHAYYRRWLSMADHLIAPSRFVAEFFGGFVSDTGRIAVIPNGTSVPRAAPDPVARLTPAERRVMNIAYIGSVVYHKGVHVTLEALQLAALPAARFRVLGHAPDGAYSGRLRETAAKIPGLAFELHGNYEVGQLPHLLSDVDCVVAPSLWPEVYGIVVREAMALGVPVLVARRGGLPEAVCEGENGFTFDATDPRQLAGLFVNLSKDEALIRRLREGAWSTPLVTPGDHAAMTSDIYKCAIDRPAGQREGVAERQERLFLHAALLDLGCGGPTVNR